MMTHGAGGNDLRLKFQAAKASRQKGGGGDASESVLDFGYSDEDVDDPGVGKYPGPGSKKIGLNDQERRKN